LFADVQTNQNKRSYLDGVYTVHA